MPDSGTIMNYFVSGARFALARDAHQHETPTVVHDAKMAGFELAYVDCDAFGGKPKDRKWFIYATEDEFLRFLESGQP
jgi:hypothetical protein